MATVHFLPRFWKAALRLGLTVLVLAALFRYVAWGDIVSTLARTELAWLVPAYALVLARRGMEAWQLTLLLRFVDCPLRWLRVFWAHALAAFYGLFTPGSVVPAAAKWTDLSAATKRPALVFNAIMCSRLLLDLQPLLIGAAALAYSSPTDSPILALVAAGLAALGLALAVCLFAPWSEPTMRLAASQVGRFLPGWARSRMNRVLDELEPFRAFPLTRHLSLAGWSFLCFAVGIAVRVMIVKSLSFDVPLLTIIWVDAVLAITSHVPITLGNFGVREGLAVVAFGPYGVPPEAAVAYGLLVYGCRVPLALIGAGYQLALIAGWTSMRSPTANAPTPAAPQPRD